jgi:peptidoglycan/xylan/chitin deacetylase (PgdA/CDA1 family)
VVTFTARLHAVFIRAGDDRSVRNRRIMGLLLTLVVTLSTGAAARMSAAASSTLIAAKSPAPAPAAAAKPRTVALTFDDGPSPYTGKVLVVLRRNHVKATFCMVGDQAMRYRAMARRVTREGHRVCNHTRTHPNMRRLSSAKARRQIADGQAQITVASGVRPTLFRFPYGASDARVRGIVRKTGLHNLTWNMDTRDWRRPPAKTITARASGHPHSGAVVLMHDGGGNRSHTVASLDATIKQYKRKGYTFVLPD